MEQPHVTDRMLLWEVLGLLPLIQRQARRQVLLLAMLSIVQRLPILQSMALRRHKLTIWQVPELFPVACNPT